ncbi:hypothetical protein [Roseimarinus sediminis]|uniref:hypothetical protein n=1 Tax=Roseimarinus sediminis TaxID=1610899 RepID=UPI003D22C330
MCLISKIIVTCISKIIWNADNKKEIPHRRKNRPVAVQVDIDTFNKIEQVLEDYALGQLINENDEIDRISLKDAEVYYKQLKKK